MRGEDPLNEKCDQVVGSRACEAGVSEWVRVICETEGMVVRARAARGARITGVGGRGGGWEDARHGA